MAVPIEEFAKKKCDDGVGTIAVPNRLIFEPLRRSLTMAVSVSHSSSLTRKPMHFTSASRRLF